MTNESSTIIEVLENASKAASVDAAHPERKMGGRPTSALAPAVEPPPAEVVPPVSPTPMTQFEANAVQNAEVHLAINRQLAAAIEGSIDESTAQLNGVRRVIASLEAFLAATMKAPA